MMCIYTCIKYFPVVLVSLMSNISPLLIALMSYVLYRVALTCSELMILLVSFVGVIILVTGSIKNEHIDEEEVKEEKISEKQSYSTEQMIFPVICLILMPLNSAFISVYLR